MDRNEQYREAIRRIDGGTNPRIPYFVIEMYNPETGKTSKFFQADRQRECKIAMGNAFKRVIVDLFGAKGFYGFAGMTAEAMQTLCKEFIDKHGMTQSPQWKGTPTKGDLGFFLNEMLQWVQQHPDHKFRVS